MISSKKIYSSIKQFFHVAKIDFFNNPLIKKFAAKFPKTYKVLVDRFSLDEFTGLPLTLILVTFLANGMLLNTFVDDFVHSKGIVLIDVSFAKLMFRMRITWLVKLFYYFSLFGSFVPVVSIAFISTVLFVVYKKKTYIVPMWVSLGGMQYTMQMGKNYFHRPRPEAYWFYHEVSYSFPSGHATVSIAFYGMLFYAIIRTRRKYASKFRWLVAGIVFIALLGFSRLYLCVHYVSDVFAGYSLGFLWLLLAVSVHEWILHRRKKRSKA